MAANDVISSAASALTEGMKIYADITDRERRAQAEQDFADRINAAGGVENLSYEDIMGAGDFLSRQQMSLGRQAIQNRQAIEAREANRAYDEKRIAEERVYQKDVLREKRVHTAQLLQDELSRKTVGAAATLEQKGKETAATRGFTISERKASDATRIEAADVRHRRTLELKQQGVADKDAARIVEEEARGEALEAVRLLAEEHGGMNNIPKIQLLPYVDDIKELGKFVDPKRLVGEADAAGAPTTQNARQMAIVEGDFAESEKMLTQLGMSKGARGKVISRWMKKKDKLHDANEALILVDDILSLGEDELGYEGAATDFIKSIGGKLGMGSKPSPYGTLMKTLNVDYAKEKLSGILSDQDMRLVRGVIGDDNLLRSGSPELRRDITRVKEAIERGIAETVGEEDIPEKAVIADDITLSPDDEALINKYAPGKQGQKLGGGSGDDTLTGINDPEFKFDDLTQEFKDKISPAFSNEAWNNLDPATQAALIKGLAKKTDNSPIVKRARKTLSKFIKSEPGDKLLTDESSEVTKEDFKTFQQGQ